MRAIFLHFAAAAIGFSALSLGTSFAAGPQITIRTLLSEMADLERLAQFPQPPYLTAQASSYDRASKSPTENWFANGDYGQFVRVERKPGRDEFVLADLKGPGAVVRIWSANPQGTIRFYVDGNDLPELIANMENLLSGKHPDFPPPFSHRLSGGANLYYPIPYRKGLKITVDNRDSNPQALYYQVQYRTYPRGTDVQSFTTAQVKDASKLAERVGYELQNPQPQLSLAKRIVSNEAELQPGKVMSLRTPPGPGEIRELKVFVTPPNENKELAYRKLLLEADFDGESAIVSPLGDFFASAPGLMPLNSLPMTISGNGAMTSRWVMPQQREGRVFLTNYFSAPVRVTIQITWMPKTWTPGTMYFRAKWKHESLKTRPMRDWNYLNATGTPGRYVGAAFFISNPVSGWWGEGDEKVYVDGETFPSTFGTGTEDYYGYAWSSPELFSHPYHNQLRCDGPGNRGYTTINRFQIFDDALWNKSFKFDMEIWHWNDVTADFAATVYWYQKPGGHDTFARPSPSDLVFFPIPEPFAVKGAIEGEDLKILDKSGGETEIQSLGEQWSNFKQIWWRDAKVGDRVSFEVKQQAARKAKLTGRFCTANDYGIVQLYWNGKKIGEPMDFYSPQIGLKTVDLGEVDVLETNRLEAEIVGKNANAAPRHMFGIDYLLLGN